MATKIIGHEGRGDFFFVNPFEVQVEDSMRGRFAPPTNEAIAALAVSMRNEGQIQPCAVKRLRDGRLVQVAGFTRNAAARLIRSGFTHDGVEYPADDSFRLKVIITSGSEQEMFFANLAENNMRNELTPMDFAIQIRNMRERYGMSTKEIVSKLGTKWSAPKVSKHEQLFDLSEQEQQLVHLGKMAIDSAIALFDAPEEVRKQIVGDAKRTGGRVKASKVRDAARDAILADVISDDKKIAEHGAVSTTEAASSAKPKPKAIARTFANVKNLLMDVSSECESVALSDLCNNLMDWIAGSLSDEQLRTSIDTLDKALDGVASVRVESKIAAKKKTAAKTMPKSTKAKGKVTHTSAAGRALGGALADALGSFTVK